MIEKPLKSVKFQTADGAYSDNYVVQDDTARKAASAAVKTVNGAAPDATGNVEVQTESGEYGGYYSPNLDGEGNLTWTPSKEGMPGVPGANVKGPKGDPGSAGHTPVKGTDYWTADDQQDIVDAVLAALPAAEGVSY